MDHDDFHPEIFSNDFGVELIWRDGSTALFGALRPGGHQMKDTVHGILNTFTCGVWHFVAATQEGAAGDIRRIAISQWHLPQFSVAEAAAALRAGRGNKIPGGRSHDVGAGFAVGSDDRGDLYWLPPTTAGRPLGVSREMTESIEADLRRLHAAQSRVTATESGFTYDGIQTPAGHQVRHHSRRLVEAIAFEKELLPKLRAENFGIYSAYCTSRDGEFPEQMPEDLMHDLVASQWSNASEDVSDEVMQLFLETQRRLLREPIWGDGVDISRAEAARILGEGMRKLPLEKRVQFVLLEGMHGAGLFLQLAVLAGCIDFEQYLHLHTSGLAPDSDEEQECRTEAAFIRLYGELAAEGERSLPVE